MGKRHRDAVVIQEGACNPSGIANAIVAACKEVRDEANQGQQITSVDDPAIRLMVHQLAYICGADDRYTMEKYQADTEECERKAND